MVKKISYFDFEEDLEVIHNKIEELELDTSVSDTDRASRLSQLKRSYAKRLSEIYSNLTDWQITQLARHPARPYTLDYIERFCTDFLEFHGDRRYADDLAIVGGFAKIDNIPVMVIGTQKGRNTKERTKRNFGMTKPEGFRKALRIMKLAEKFGLPVITFVDTPGAYPGIDAEERNQAEAIGRSIFELTHLKVPVISVIIGRSPCACCGRHGDDSPVRCVFGYQPRRLRLDSLERRRQGPGSGRIPFAHGDQTF